MPAGGVSMRPLFFVTLMWLRPDRLPDHFGAALLVIDTLKIVIA
jgi:hypothetical protein